MRGAQTEPRDRKETRNKEKKKKKREIECALYSIGLYRGQDQLHLGAKEIMKEHDGNAQTGQTAEI